MAEPPFAIPRNVRARKNSIGDTSKILGQGQVPRSSQPNDNIRLSDIVEGKVSAEKTIKYKVTFQSNINWTISDEGDDNRNEVFVGPPLSPAQLNCSKDGVTNSATYTNETNSTYSTGDGDGDGNGNGNGSGKKGILVVGEGDAIDEVDDWRDTVVWWKPQVFESHNENYEMWNEGEMASRGIAEFAQDGTTRGIEQELKAAKGAVGSYVLGRRMGLSKARQNITGLMLNKNYPYISMAAVLDVGIFGGFNFVHPVVQNGTDSYWYESFTVGIFLYDAGLPRSLPMPQRPAPLTTIEDAGNTTNASIANNGSGLGFNDAFAQQIKGPIFRLRDLPENFVYLDQIETLGGDDNTLQVEDFHNVVPRPVASVKFHRVGAKYVSKVDTSTDDDIVTGTADQLEGDPTSAPTSNFHAIIRHKIKEKKAPFVVVTLIVDMTVAFVLLMVAREMGRRLRRAREGYEMVEQ